MQVMYDGPKASGALSEATALKGRNLYYHLKELIHAAYVREQNRGYDLTSLGCQMLVVARYEAGGLSEYAAGMLFPCATSRSSRAPQLSASPFSAELAFSHSPLNCASR
jgi:hypothetical protein